MYQAIGNEYESDKIAYVKYAGTKSELKIEEMPRNSVESNAAQAKGNKLGCVISEVRR
jgi:hypothetical protein